MAVLFVSICWMPFLAPTLDNDSLFALMITPCFHLHLVEVADQDPVCGCQWNRYRNVGSCSGSTETISLDKIDQWPKSKLGKKYIFNTKYLLDGGRLENISRDVKVGRIVRWDELIPGRALPNSRLRCRWWWWFCIADVLEGLSKSLLSR